MLILDCVKSKSFLMTSDLKRTLCIKRGKTLKGINLIVCFSRFKRYGERSDFMVIGFIIFLVLLILFSKPAYAGNWNLTNGMWKYDGEAYTATSWNSKAQVDEAIGAVNDIRSQNNLPTLERDNILMQAAAVRARELSKKFSHVRPDGTNPETATNGVYTLVGENIAMGQESSLEVMTDWMNSPSHRENILFKYYTRIGVATYESYGKTYWVQLFLME